MGLFARQRERAAQALAAEYQAEGLRYAGVCGGWLTLRDFRSPGLRSSLEKTTMRFTLVLTESRMRLGAYYNRYRTPIDNPWTDPGFAQLRVSVDDKAKLQLEFRAEAFRDDSSGSVVARLKLADAAEAAKLIEQLRHENDAGHARS